MLAFTQYNPNQKIRSAVIYGQTWISPTVHTNQNCQVKSLSDVCIFGFEDSYVSGGFSEINSADGR